MADRSRSGFQPLEMHDWQQWTAVCIGSLAVRTNDNRRRRRLWIEMENAQIVFDIDVAY